MAGGRPLRYKTVEELDNKINEYFSGGYRKIEKHNKDGKAYEVARITISDICLFLGFCDKQSFYDYEKRPEFSYSIKRARLMVEREYEERLDSPSCTGAIFALKNFGWRDKQELDLTSKGESINKIERKIIDANPDDTNA